jgi:hypothetical protein
MSRHAFAIEKAWDSLTPGQFVIPGRALPLAPPPEEVQDAWHPAAACGMPKQVATLVQAFLQRSVAEVAGLLLPPPQPSVVAAKNPKTAAHTPMAVNIFFDMPGPLSSILLRR